MQAWKSQPDSRKKELLQKADAMLLSDPFAVKVAAFAAGIADSVAVAHEKVAWALQPTPIDVDVKVSRLQVQTCIYSPFNGLCPFLCPTRMHSQHT